jgi:uncharacterized membrane protein
MNISYVLGHNTNNESWRTKEWIFMYLIVTAGSAALSAYLFYRALTF